MTSKNVRSTCSLFFGLFLCSIPGLSQSGGRTPIIISGGSITVNSLPVSDGDSWDKHKQDKQHFIDIPVADASVFQFVPSGASGTDPSNRFGLADSWKVVIVLRDDSEQRHRLILEGSPSKFSVSTSHNFSDRPHDHISGYDGRSFCDAEGCDPATFHIGQVNVVSGLLDGDGNALPRQTFKCSDDTCKVQIGKPQ